MNISFRTIARSDFQLLQKWLAEPHVKEWWHDDLDTKGLGASITSRMNAIFLGRPGKAASSRSRQNYRDLCPSGYLMKSQVTFSIGEYVGASPVNASR